MREFAFDQRFKLYRSGAFFDLTNDPEEKQSVEVPSRVGEAVAAAKRLQGALDRFQDARPAERDGPAQLPKQGSRKSKKAAPEPGK